MTSTNISVIVFILWSGLIYHTDSVPWPRPSEGGCDAELSCLPLSQCSFSQKDYETSFPCNAFGEADIKVCCTPGGNLGNRDGGPSPKTSSTTPSTTTTTKSSTAAKTTKMTTPKPRSTTQYVPFTLDNLWDNIPQSLQDKLSLLPEDCGRMVIANKIINGMDADLGEFPWMALLGYEDPATNTPVFFCGGTLINNRYILTAAHCAKAGNNIPTLIRLGEWNIQTEKDCVKLHDGSDDCSDPVVDVPIENFIKHELYGNRSFPLLRFDIALVRMARAVEFTDFIHPICLSGKLHRNPKDRYTVAGWGVTDNESWKPSNILQFISVKLFDFNECNAIAPAEVSPLMRNSQFCAGGIMEQDACRGDSGGPLTFSLHNKEYQKGIVSLATSQICGREGKPTVYTEVANFIRWILSNMEP